MAFWDRLPLGRWLQRGEAAPETGGTAEELDALEAKAASASASFRPQHYLRAAQLAESLGLESRALANYGAAIDGYLEAGRSRAAEVVCRQVVDAYPRVVRARRTLALIALGRGDTEEAVALLREYVENARRFGDETLTRKSLRTMGLIAEPGPARSRAAEELDALGDETGARMVAEREAEAEDDFTGGAAGSWAKALQAALLGADELRR